MNNENTITVGMPVTYSNGRDSYPYYVVEVSANQKKVALARARFTLDSYAEGTGKVAQFDPNAKADLYIAKYGRHWYEARKDDAGNIIRIPGRYSRYGRYTFGVAAVYQDPHF
jgi:hypothetical protein